MSTPSSTPSCGKPIMTFDLDGVVCQPPFGINVGISRNLDVPPLAGKVASRSVRDPQSLAGAVTLVLAVLRYAGRRPMPDAREGLLAIRQYREPILVTARGALVLPFVERWLRRYGLYECFSTLRANHTTLRPAQFKLYMVRELGAAGHVDDDGATVYYLARHGAREVYLRDWPRNRGLPYPPGVQVVRSLFEVAEKVARSGADGGPVPGS